MLVIPRTLGGQVVIGEGPDRIVLTVLGIARGRVRLGIERPDGVKVYREEELPLARHRAKAAAEPEGSS